MNERIQKKKKQPEFEPRASELLPKPLPQTHRWADPNTSVTASLDPYQVCIHAMQEVHATGDTTSQKTRSLLVGVRFKSDVFHLLLGSSFECLAIAMQYHLKVHLSKCRSVKSKWLTLNRVRSVLGIVVVVVLVVVIVVLVFRSWSSSA